MAVWGRKSVFAFCALVLVLALTLEINGEENNGTTINSPAASESKTLRSREGRDAGFSTSGLGGGSYGAPPVMIHSGGGGGGGHGGQYGAPMQSYHHAIPPIVMVIFFYIF